METQTTVKAIYFCSIDRGQNMSWVAFVVCIAIGETSYHCHSKEHSCLQSFPIQGGIFSYNSDSQPREERTSMLSLAAAVEMLQECEQMEHVTFSQRRTFFLIKSILAHLLFLISEGFHKGHL